MKSNGRTKRMGEVINEENVECSVDGVKGK